MLLQRVWGVCRLRNAKRLGMLGGTLASCALALATVVPSAYAFACGIQNHHKTTQTSGNHHIHKTTQASNSRAHESSTVRYVYVYKCSCERDHHSSSTNHTSASHSTKSDKKSDNSHHDSGGNSGNGGSSKSSSSQQDSSQPSSVQSASNLPTSAQSNSSGSGSGTTPGLPFTGSDPD